MSRLELSDTVVKRLFALSGNQCAYPGCEQMLIDLDGSLIGEICHIEAASSKGQRFNNNSTDDERRSFENLILLCSNHHKKTNNVKIYSPEKLRQFKLEHMNMFKNKKIEVPSTIIQKAIKMQMQQTNTNTGSGTQII